MLYKNNCLSESSGPVLFLISFKHILHWATVHPQLLTCFYLFPVNCNQGFFLFICIQRAFTRDGLCLMWNELVKDGEITNNSSDGLINSAGVLAKKGKLFNIIFLKSHCAMLSAQVDKSEGKCVIFINFT